MAHWAPEVANRWTHLPAPEFTEQLIDTTSDGCEAIQAGRTIKEFERRRDRCLVAIQNALDEFWFPPDQDGWPDMPQYLRLSLHSMSTVNRQCELSGVTR